MRVFSTGARARDPDTLTLSPMTKRSHDDIDVDDIIDSIKLDHGLRAGLLELTLDELADVLADVANEARLPTAIFKEARIDLPSFFAVKWSEYAKEFGLPNNIEYLCLVPVKTPKYRLPPSLHEAIFENSWRWLDVYREKVSQQRGNAKVRLLQPVCQPNSGYMRCTD